MKIYSNWALVMKLGLIHVVQRLEMKLGLVNFTGVRNIGMKVKFVLKLKNWMSNSRVHTTCYNNLLEFRA